MDEGMVTSRIADVGHCDEDFKRILFIGLSYSSLDFAFDFGFPFLPVASEGVGMSIMANVVNINPNIRREPKVLLITP